MPGVLGAGTLGRNGVRQKDAVRPTDDHVLGKGRRAGQDRNAERRGREL